MIILSVISQAREGGGLRANSMVSNGIENKRKIDEGNGGREGIEKRKKTKQGVVPEGEEFNSLAAALKQPRYAQCV